MPKKISVIIPTYNRAHLVLNSVQSVLDQTFSDYELIIIDDGSSDNTKEALEPLFNSGAIQYVYQDNQGSCAARNLGIKKSVGQFLAFLDDDDVWMPTKLEEQIKAFKINKRIGVVYTDFLTADSAGQLIGSTEKAYRIRDKFEEELLYRNVVRGSASSVMIRRECFDTVGLFDENMRSAGDHDMWRRIAQHYKFHYINKPLVTISFQIDGMQTNIDKFTRGRVQYVKKLFLESKDKKSKHINRKKASEVAYFIYFDIAQKYFARQKYLKSLYYLVLIIGLGPKFTVSLIRDSFRLLEKKIREPIRDR